MGAAKALKSRVARENDPYVTRAIRNVTAMNATRLTTSVVIISPHVSVAPNRLTQHSPIS